MLYLSSFFLMLIPFSYAFASGFRLLLVQVVIAFCVLLVSAVKIGSVRVSLTDICTFLLVLVLGGQAVVSGYFNEFFALTVFILLLYSSSAIFRVTPSGSFDFFVGIYAFSALLSALGVIFQWGVHRFLNIEIFNYQLFGGGRNAYGFVWSDYSFLSLYLASAIPLLFGRLPNLLFLAFSFLLTFASIVTSARTGVAALVIFLALFVGLEFLRALLVRRVKKYLVFIGVIFLIMPFFMLYGLENLTGRALTASSSGRFDGFIKGWDYFSDNVIFGALMDKDFFSEQISIIPHNIFLYMLFMGGVSVFMVFVFWFASVIREIRCADGRVLSSLLICFIGFQFIPSFFSAYFVAVLLGMGLSSSHEKRISAVSNKVHYQLQPRSNYQSQP